MMMLVGMWSPGTKRRWLLGLLFLILTVGPWIVLIWLIWPRA